MTTGHPTKTTPSAMGPDFDRASVQLNAQWVHDEQVGALSRAQQIERDAHVVVVAPGVASSKPGLYPVCRCIARFEVEVQRGVCRYESNDAR